MSTQPGCPPTWNRAGPAPRRLAIADAMPRCVALATSGAGVIPPPTIAAPVRLEGFDAALDVIVGEYAVSVDANRDLTVRDLRGRD